MPFVHKIVCTDCGQDVQDPQAHDCPESPEKVEQRRIENEKWEREYEAEKNAWEAWGEDDKLKSCRPSCGYHPTEVAFEGRCQVIYIADWSDRGHNFVSPVLENPTWGDVALQFDRAIPMVDDHHHVFLEGLHPLDISEWPEELGSPDADVTILHFSTGS